MSVGRCLQQLELALHYDARSLMVLQQTSPSMRKALQEGLLEVFCKLVRQPVAGHNLTGAIWKLACLSPRGHAPCLQEVGVLGCGIDGPWFERWRSRRWGILPSRKSWSQGSGSASVTLRVACVFARGRGGPGPGAEALRQGSCSHQSRNGR
ncbi:unnamed protein product [Durusdinium trenchii]|uniref:Uncharacterized protein n=1 Tax=Durusdinium trenchii TaxID=1381693 RepID=A0ABP0RRI4_9DINO